VASCRIKGMSSSFEALIKKQSSTTLGSAVSRRPGPAAASETTQDREPCQRTAAPFVLYDHVDAGQSQPPGLTYQQRQERLQGLADVFVSIFCSLSPDQRARYMSEETEQQAA
jgi:hypothetical protein